MPKWLTVVLLVVAVLVGTCGLVISGGMWWFNKNRAQLEAAGAEATVEGEAFAKDHDDSSCVEEAFGRLAVKSGFLDEARHKVFLKTCLRAAARTPGFCTGVPAPDDIMGSAGWAITTCGKRVRGDQQACGRLMHAVQEACHSGR